MAVHFYFLNLSFLVSIVRINVED